MYSALIVALTAINLLPYIQNIKWEILLSAEAYAKLTMSL